MSVISLTQARELTLERLRQWLRELPASERQRPRKIIEFKAYSVLDLIREVEANSELGRTITYDTVKSLGYVVQ